MKKTGGHSIHTVFALGLFCIFAITILFTLIMGARVYKNMEADGEASYAQSMGLSYLAEKLRHGDGSAEISVGEFGGRPALYLREEYAGNTYQTAIYAYEGWLCELYAEEGLDFAPEDGERVLACRAAEFEETEPGLLRIRLWETDGHVGTLHLNLRSGRCLAP